MLETKYRTNLRIYLRLHIGIICTKDGKLALYALIDSCFWFDTINFEMSIVNIEGSPVIIPKNVLFRSQKNVFALANSVALMKYRIMQYFI